MLNNITIPLSIAVIAYTWVNCLVGSGDLLEFIPRYWHKKTDISKNYIQKLTKVLFQCEMCFSGQLAFWSFPWFAYKYTVFGHVFAVILSIFFAKCLTKLLR